MSFNNRICSRRFWRSLAVGILLFGIQNHPYAQFTAKPDSFISQDKIYYQPIPVTAKSFIIPVGLIVTGAISISGEFNQAIQEERDEHFNTFHTNIDDYLQYAPVVAGYAMLINNPQHSFWKYTEKLVLTEVIMTGLVYSTKNITKVSRPDTRAPTSFPSGHTAQAFAGATLFCDEFAQHKPWLAITVYSGAATVGVLRILNNRHWTSDIIAGAGFGMLSAKLSEWIVQPRRKKKTFNNQF